VSEVFLRVSILPLLGEAAVSAVLRDGGSIVVVAMVFFFFFFFDQVEVEVRRDGAQVAGRRVTLTDRRGVSGDGPTW
jgi:hypothetical protein